MTNDDADKHDEEMDGFESVEDLKQCSESAMKMSSLDDLITEYE